MSGERSHILVVDDDPKLCNLLARFLSENGFIVATAACAADARATLANLVFDLLILDVMMPGETGFEFAAELRRESTVPILMLTAMGEPEDRIAGLERGADDYMTKPFEPRELLLRVNNILRRATQPTPPGIITLGGMTFDPEREELRANGETIRLTSVEAALLREMALREGEILSRDDLIELTGAAGGGRAVDVQVTRLRRKIEADPREPRYLQTVRGKGYVLKPD